MISPPGKLRRDTRVFISAVSRELGSVRKLVKKGLEDNDYHAVEQDNFPPDYRDLVDKLRERIASCDAVVHIAGHCFGAEPPQRPDGTPRRSDTQMEYDLAVELGKPVYVFLTADRFPTDPHEPEDEAQTRLQSEHRQRLTATGHDYNPTATREELDQKIRTLQLKIKHIEEELTHVDQHVTTTGRRLDQRFAIGVVVFVVLIAAIGISIADIAKEERDKTLQSLMLNAELLEKKLEWNHALQLREQIVELAPNWFQARNNLGCLLRQLARYSEAEPHYRAALTLAENPTDEAIAQSNLAQLLQATNRLAEAEPLMHRALAIDEKSHGAEHPKVAIRLNNLAHLLQATNRFAEAEPLMRRALAIDEQSYGAEHPSVAREINNLAALLYNTNRVAQAEPLMRRALAIDEQSHGSQHPDVATDLSNLAQLLQATNRLAEAEPLMRRALAIDEKSYGVAHPDVSIRLNNLAQLLTDTNRPAEAEPLMRRALAIDEKSYGAEHPEVALCLNNLAQLLTDTNRLAEAEPLMRRALAIDEQSYGAEHPEVALCLSNLAMLLLDTNRLAEAEPLMRRALAITGDFKRRTGHEHPSYQGRLEQYSDLLPALNLPDVEVAKHLKAAISVAEPLKPIAAEVERLLGPAKSVTEVLAAMDRQYKADGKPAVYFLSPKEPIAPHLDELLGKSKIDLLLDQPIAPQLDKLLGPARSTKEVFEELDRQYREQNKPPVWFLPLSEPIAPHLDELLGPVPKTEKE
jgi:tetratricopeptide (TPR) repeat protein